MIVYGVAVADMTVAKRHALRSVMACAGIDSRIVVGDATGGIPTAWNEVLDTAAREPDLEAVVLLHDDTEFSERHLEAKVRAVLGSGDEPDAPAILAAAGSRGGDSVRWWDAADTVGILGSRDERWQGRLGVGDVDRVDDSFLVIAADLVRRGERFAVDVEGTPLGATQATADLCRRVRRDGRRIAVLPVTHQHLGSPGHDATDWVPDVGVPVDLRPDAGEAQGEPICLLAPDVELNVHAHAFDEVQLALGGGLRRLGYDVHLETSAAAALERSERTIVLAPHLHPLAVLKQFPVETDFYNWEPLGEAGNGVTSRELASFLSTRTVWDYSLRNLDFWDGLGTQARHLAVGYDPSLEQLEPRAARRDIDVLFYGSLTPRRQRVLQDIQRRGIGLHYAFGAYGHERDALIRRSRMLLNLHSYEHSTLEVARLGHLWSNQVPVICEIGPNTEDSLGMAETTLHAPIGDLADLVESALADPTDLELATLRSRERFAREADAARQLADVL